MTTELATTNQLTREQVELVKHTVAVGATDNELKMFLYQAGKRGLDPLTRQIHFIKRNRYNPDTEKYESVGTIQTGIDGFRVIADRTGRLSGINRGILKDKDDKLIGAWAEVHRSDWQHPAREEVSFKEYCQKKKDGSPIGLWATMPETMIKKVAEAAALRMAFPEDLSGIYTHDEMQQADTEVISVTEVKKPEAKPKPATKQEPSPESTPVATQPVASGNEWTTDRLLGWVAEVKGFKTTGTSRSFMVNALKVEESRIDNDPQGVYDEIKDMLAH